MSFFLFLSLSFSPSGYFSGAQRPSGFTFLPGLLRPSREGALCLHPLERAPEAFVNRASPAPGALLAFCVNQGISASFSLLYFLIGRLRTTRFQSIKGPQHSSSVVPFSPCLQSFLASASFPVSGSYPVSQCFASDGQNIEASA